MLELAEPEVPEAAYMAQCFLRNELCAAWTLVKGMGYRPPPPKPLFPPGYNGVFVPM